MWAGVDSVWEQEKTEARKMLENAAESHTSGARFVGRTLPNRILVGRRARADLSDDAEKHLNSL